MSSENGTSVYEVLDAELSRLANDSAAILKNLRNIREEYLSLKISLSETGLELADPTRYRKTIKGIDTEIEEVDRRIGSHTKLIEGLMSVRGEIPA